MTNLSGVTIGLSFAGAIADKLEARLHAAGYDTYRGWSDQGSRILRSLGAKDVAAWVFDPADEAAFETFRESGKFLLPAEDPPPPADAERLDAWCDVLLGHLSAANLTCIGQQHNLTSPAVLRGVWLLAGSAGATSAVQRFFRALATVPPVGFIYAQHFDPRQQQQLGEFDLDNPKYELKMIEGDVSLAPGRVCMVPPSHRVLSDRFGTLKRTKESWGPGHTPDINELMIMLAASGLTGLGIIVFSGMGDDASSALDVFDSVGASIWAQSLETAICDGMPRAACATGLVHRTGSPEQLADALSLLYAQSS